MEKVIKPIALIKQYNMILIYIKMDVGRIILEDFIHLKYTDRTEKTNTEKCAGNDKWKLF